MTPQPAGHSRHTVENHEATPGTICSLGTTSGRIFSAACWHPPAAAAAPVVVMILKNSRRFMYRALLAGSSRRWLESSAMESSVVAGHTVKGRPRAAGGVLRAATVDPPSHRERGD